MLLRYIRKQADLHRAAVRSLLYRTQAALPPRPACSVKNLMQRFDGNAARFDFDPEDGLFRVREAGDEHVFAQKMRGFNLYGPGIRTRGEALFASYLLDRIDFAPDDVVVDCGANYADLFIALKSRMRPENYWAFEPDPEAFRCAERNAQGGNHSAKGLAATSGESVFHLSSLGANSCIMTPGSYTERITIQTTTLDAMVREAGWRAVKVLKLEAEGYEPEVLDGADRFLRICEYVAVDGSAERGEIPRETLSTVTTRLVSAGFDMVGVRADSLKALFRRGEMDQL